MKGTITRPIPPMRRMHGDVTSRVEEYRAIQEEIEKRGLTEVTVYYGTMAERMKRSKGKGKVLPKAERDARIAALKARLKK